MLRIPGIILMNIDVIRYGLDSITHPQHQYYPQKKHEPHLRIDVLEASNISSMTLVISEGT